MLAVLLVLGAAGGEARAEEPDTEPSLLGTHQPPSVAGPSLRSPLSPTRLSLDGAYGFSNDLSSLPYIAGRGRNVRFALAGTYRWGELSLDVEIPFVNVTTLTITEVLNEPPLPGDARQTSVGFGDAALGAVWSRALVGPDALVGGLGLRTRLATHTTRFDFHLIDGSPAIFAIPYYFHIEPTVVLGGAVGRFVFVVNQGAVALIGPDGNFVGMHVTEPTVWFWDAHYAVSCAPWSFLGASVELSTQIQLNHVGDARNMIDGQDFTKFNHIHAAWIAPALQLHFGETRVDLIARLGLTRGQEVYGVLEYVGTSSFTLRVTQTFN